MIFLTKKVKCGVSKQWLANAPVNKIKGNKAAEMAKRSEYFFPYEYDGEYRVPSAWEKKMRATLIMPILFKPSWINTWAQ